MPLFFPSTKQLVNVILLAPIPQPATLTVVVALVEKESLEGYVTRVFLERSTCLIQDVNVSCLCNENII